MRIAPLVQAAPFDIAHWAPDAEFAIFPQGARAKDAVFAPAAPPESVIVPEKRYLFKRSREIYPDQFWCEIIAYRVGCLMGLPVPPAFAAYNATSGVSAALIEWFYQDGEEHFVLAGDFLQKIQTGFDRETGAHHNLTDITRLLRALVIEKALTENWRQWWVEALLFDALIGNTDRHQDNWGLLFEAVWRAPTKMPACRLAPLFDNGTSLGHERFPDRVATWNEARLDHYIARGTHHVKLGLDPGLRLQGHGALLQRVLLDWAPQLDQNRLRSRLDFSAAELSECFADLAHLPMPESLSPARIQWVCRLLIRRHATLKALLDATA